MRARPRLRRRALICAALGAGLSSARAGRYAHHSVTTLEFEIKRHRNLDVSLLWDYLGSPQVKSDVTVPKSSDLNLIAGFGVRF